MVKVGKTLLVASGSHGKFVSRLDLDVRDGEVKGFRFKLIPVFSDAIASDAEMAARSAKIRGPHEKMLRETDRHAPTRCSTGAAISTARSTT